MQEQVESQFEHLITILYSTIFQYETDKKNPNSWVAFYAPLFPEIKFPNFTFNESLEFFSEKTLKLLDIMELTHQYVKISNPSLYVESNHLSVMNTKNFIKSELKKMTLPDFNELREHLRSAILYGNN